MLFLTHSEPQTVQACSVNLPPGQEEEVSRKSELGTAGALGYPTHQTSRNFCCDPHLSVSHLWFIMNEKNGRYVHVSGDGECHSGCWTD